MTTSQLHDFHFVILKSVKKKIKGMRIFNGISSFSGIIVKILSSLAPIIKQEHTWGEERKSRYSPISDDPDEIRENTHVYMPMDLYRELKLIHQDLNFYSLAQIVREFLDVFLDLVDKFGDKIWEELRNIYEKWNKEEKRDHLTLRQYMRQLFVIIQHLPKKNRLINIYDSHFSPFWKLRL